MQGFHRSTGVLVAFLATTALSGAAYAQSISDIPPPARFQVDENGVNAADGSWNHFEREISIGPNGPGGLAFVQQYGHDVRGDLVRSNNFNLSIYSSSFNGVTSVFASTGFTSEVFTLSGSDHVSSLADGSMLVKSGTSSAPVYTLTTGDGTIIVYNFNGRDSNDTSRLSRATSITYPTGDKVTLSWGSASWCPNHQDNCLSGQRINGVRLETADHSTGYRLTFNYVSPQIIDPIDGDTWKVLANVEASNRASSCATSCNWPTTRYSESGSTRTVTDPAGRTTTYTGTPLQSTIKRPASGAADVTVTYNNFARVTAVNNDGLTTNYNLAAGTITDPLGHMRVITTNAAVGLPASVQDELGRVTSYHYDAFGRLDKSTAPEGNSIQYVYNDRGNVTQQIAVAKAGSGLPNITTSATYDISCTNPVKCNKPNSTTDARGNTTDYAYDPTHGGVTSITYPAPLAGATRPQTRYSYAALQAFFRNASGTLVASGVPSFRLTGISQCQTAGACSGSADEVKTSIAYGAPGVENNLLPTSVSSGSGNGSLTATVTTSYDLIGNVLSIDGPLAGAADTTRNHYNADRELIGTISPDPDGAGPLKMRAVRNSYNGDGHLTKVERGTVNGSTDADLAAMTVLETGTIGYDTASRPVTYSIAGSDGIVRAMGQQGYDGDGRPDCYAVRMNSAAFGSLPASACSLGTQGSFGPDRVTRTIYDAADQVTQQQVAVGTTDAATEATYTYSANGKLATLKDGENNLTTYVYDGHDRLSQTRFPVTAKGASSSSTTDFEQLTYDAASNVSSRRLRDGQSIAFTYDNLNRVTLKDLPASEPDVTYAYDNLGRLTSASQTGNALSFTYDALSRNLTQVGPQGTVTSAYDLAGRRIQLTYPGSGLFLTYDYLVTGETVKIRENGATSGIGVLATYAYDDLGRRISLTFGNGVSQAYGFDAVSRLASLTNNLAGTTNDLSQTLSYNPASQIISNVRTGDAYAWTGHHNQTRNYNANGLNQFTAAGPLTPTYDARGNLTTDPNTGAAYGYSSENMLTSASGGVALAYDPVMRLTQLSVGATVTRFAYDGVDMLAEYNGSNTLQRRFVHGPGADEAIVWYEGSGTTDRRFLSSDERGSSISVTDGSGAVLALNSYDEYGIPGAANAGRFQYTGQAWLPELGIQYSKARLYSPTLGRFLQTDPIGTDGGINLYAYVGNDPVNLVDPAGTFGLVGFAIGAGISYGAQVIQNFANGQTGTNAFTNVNVGQILVSGALGSLGGFGLGLSAATGTARFIPLITAPILLNKAERVAVGGLAVISLATSATVSYNYKQTTGTQLPGIPSTIKVGQYYGSRFYREIKSDVEISGYQYYVDANGNPILDKNGNFIIVEEGGE